MNQIIVETYTFTSRVCASRKADPLYLNFYCICLYVILISACLLSILKAYHFCTSAASNSPYRAANPTKFCEKWD